jgi:hypothetical protein
MKINRNQKNLLKKKLAQQNSWFLLSKSYSGKVREAYILLYKSIQEYQNEKDSINNKWQSLTRTIGGKGE